MDITITPEAGKRAAALIVKEGAVTSLRIGLRGGGCSGYEYYFTMDSKKDGDLEKTGEGYSILVDKLSLALLDGSIIDYIDDVSGSHFAINNPNVKHGCGCGKSVSI